MPRPVTYSKIGKRLNAALRRKGVEPIDVMNALGGRAIQTWYRWVNGEQEGGWKDLAAAGMFLEMTPDELMLEDESLFHPDFSEEDVVQFESLRAMLQEMTKLSDGQSEARPVAVVYQHAKILMKLLKGGKTAGGLAKGKKAK